MSKTAGKKFTVPTVRMKIGNVHFSVTKSGAIMGNNPTARQLVANLESQGINWKLRARKVTVASTPKKASKVVAKETSKKVASKKTASKSASRKTSRK
jgi:hypothetical protein